MMTVSPLFGRRVHIAGSVHDDLSVASTEELNAAREFVAALVAALMRKGATFVVPVDADKTRAGDNLPITFDWLVWESLNGNLARRPTGAPNPLAVAVQHHKSEDQVPAAKCGLWDGLRGTELVSIDNASHWNMNSKRMEMQALRGDIVITIGGAEGVLFLANLYHLAGKPVIPLNYALCPSDTGSRKLFNQALISQQTVRFFRTTGRTAPHDWINRINFSQRHDVSARVNTLVELLEALEKPTVFAVRLLNPKAPEFQSVEDYFTGVVQHVIEQEFGYTLKVVDGKQANEHPRIDEEIFNKLHHSAVVVADLTGLRPNCLIELGYALGRSIPTIVTAQVGTQSPFDIKTLADLPWDPSTTLNSRRQEFRNHWEANIRRPALVTPEPLIP